MPLTRDWSQAAADVAVTAWGSHRAGTACPPKKAVREAASRLFHQLMHQRAGPPFAPPSISPQGSEPNGSGPTGAGCSTSLFAPTYTSSPSWPDLVRPPTLGTHRRCQDVDPGSSPGMTARGLRGARRERVAGTLSPTRREGNSALSCTRPRISAALGTGMTVRWNTGAVRVRTQRCASQEVDHRMHRKVVSTFGSDVRRLEP